MVDRKILNLHSKKIAFGYNSKLKILPVRCQTNTLLKSEGKREVNFFYHGSTLTSCPRTFSQVEFTVYKCCVHDCA